jgi:hypothetical protein
MMLSFRYSAKSTGPVRWSVAAMAPVRGAYFVAANTRLKPNPRGPVGSPGELLAVMGMEVIFISVEGPFQILS